MRSLVIGLAGAVAAILSTTAALAQEGYRAPPPQTREITAPPTQGPAQTATDPKSIARGMKEAPALIQQAGYPCTVAEATFRGQGSSKNAEGKTIKTSVYEVACQGSFGYIIQAPEGATPNVFNCLAIASNPAGGLTCILPSNAQPVPALQALVTQAGARCTVTQARWMGASSTGKYDQYEVGCSEGPAMIVQAPQPGSTEKLTVVSCIELGQVSCQYFPRERVVAAIAAMSQPANRTACQVTEARWMGRTSTGATYYEVGCADKKSGYVFQTDASGRFVSALECARASGIGGGCTYTDAVAAQSEGASTYTKLVAQVGYPCTVKEYRSVGVDAQKREVVELICTDKPGSVIALLPSTPGVKGEVMNCVRASVRGVQCRLSTNELNYAAVATQISGKGQTCQVSNTRGMGTDPEGNDFVEVACTGGTGMVVKYAPGMDTPREVIACKDAKGIGGGCKLG